MNLMQPMMVSALLIGGMGVAFLGTIKVPLARRLHIDEARVGGLVGLFGFTIIPIVFTAGFLTDRFGGRGVMIGGSALFTLSLFCLAAAHTYRSALVGVILMSAGWALLANVGNVLVPQAFAGSAAFAANLANVFFGLGAFLTPLLIGWLLGRVEFGRLLGLLGLVTLLPALLALGVNFSSQPPSAADFSTILADPMIWLLGLTFFCYSPLEASLGAWATTYLQGHDIHAETASGLLSSFWLAYMLARLATALWLPRDSETLLILLLSAGAFAIFLVLVVNRSRSMAMALIPIAGLVFGPIFPTLMALLYGHFPEDLHGRAVGLFFMMGGMGWTLIPNLIGRYAQRTSVQQGFLIAVVAAAGLVLMAAILMLWT